LYRDGNKIEGIELHFKDGLISRAKATSNQSYLDSLIAVADGNKVGEYSLTDRRHSQITKVMGETLYDENM
jgi:aminopeptidase